MALFVDQSEHVARLPGQKVQDFLVVGELYVVPQHALFLVLFLLQLEDVGHKELLQLLVSEVDAKLLKTGKRGKKKYKIYCKRSKVCKIQ